MNMYAEVGLALFLVIVVIIVAKSHKQNKSEESAHLRRAKWERDWIEEILAVKTLDELLKLKKLLNRGSVQEDIAEIIHEEFSAQEVISAGYNIKELVAAAERAPKKGESRRTAVAKIRRLHIPAIKPTPETQ